MLSWNVAVVGQSELGCCAGHSPLLEACLHLIGRRRSTICPYCNSQGDHSPRKPGKVSEFQSGHWSEKSQGKWKKSGEVKSGVFFQALNTPISFFGRGSALDPAGGAYDASPDSLVGWGDTPSSSPPVTTPTVK